MKNEHGSSRFAFFGTPRFAEIILDELEQAGYVPTVVVTAPDKPKGRKLLLAPSEVKLWAQKRGIPVLTPENLHDKDFVANLKKADCELFVVAAYGKIIPKTILDIPPYGALNVHPSLLPKFRGPSPVESVILSDETATGVTIIALDEQMDHGPIVAQRERVIGDWPPKGSELTLDLAHFGGALLVEIIPEWRNGLRGVPQDHWHATFTKKITKEDGLIELSGDPFFNYKKIRAFDGWPGAYFFTERNGKKMRVVVSEARYENGLLIITRVIPEGKKAMSYEDFLRGEKGA